MGAPPIDLLFLIADIGGGHRAPAEAVREALRRTVGDAARVTLVDVLAERAPWPFSRGRVTYAATMRWARPLQSALYHGLNGPRRMRAAALALWPLRAGLRAALRDHPASLVVSFHPTYSYPLAALGAPCVFVFTDLVTNHALWCAPGARRYLVPTALARDGALRLGVPPERLSVTGLPVHPRFAEPAGTAAPLRRRLELRSERPVVLLSGGGDGLGRVVEVARAIGWSGLDAQLVVLAGRNAALAARLRAGGWPMETTVVGFTEDVADWMAVGVVLVTKAGSSTLAEGLARGLPMIVFDRMPGQEEGNPELIARAGAGAACSEPAQVVGMLRSWLARPALLAAMAEGARRVARPRAAFEVAEIVYELAGGSPLERRRAPGVGVKDLAEGRP